MSEGDFEELASDMDTAVTALRKSLHPSRLGFVPDSDLAEYVELACGILQAQASRMRDRAAGRSAR